MCCYSKPLGAKAILFFFSTWTLTWPHIQMFCFWWVVLLIYWLFTCYFNYFDLVFHIPYLNCLREISTFSTLIKPYQLHHTAHSLNWYKNHFNRQWKIKQQHYTAIAMLRLEYTWTFKLRCSLEEIPSEHRWSGLRLEYTSGISLQVFLDRLLSRATLSFKIKTKKI